MELDAEGCPQFPCVIISLLFFGGDPLGNGFKDKAEFMAERVAVIGVTTVQDGWTG
jgi:hypothetical protein